MTQILIVGAGPAGLLANHVLSSVPGVRVSVLDPGRPGGAFTADGGLKYIHKTPNMLKLFGSLGLGADEYHVQGGILLRGKVHPFPAVLKELGKEQADRIRADHYFKTRRAEPDGGQAAKAMNDPEASGPRHGLRCDLGAFVNALARRAVLVADSMAGLAPGQVVGASERRFPFDYLVLTVPLWIVRRMAWFALPEALALKLNVVRVNPIGDPYAKWDYVYTPYTPENLLHRLSPSDDGYQCEFNGEWIEGETNTKLTSDLNFLFPNGWALDAVKKGLNGHLLPLRGPAEWPANVRPLGRFAQWDSRATVDAVLDSSIRLAKDWFGHEWTA